MEKLIEIKDVSVAYNKKWALQNITFDLWKDDFVGVIGPNGGGKTTLLKIILGLLKPTSGSVKYFHEGKQVSSLKMGYLPQMNPIDKHFPISVYEVIASGLAGEKPRFHDFSAEQKAKVEKFIVKMGLENLSKQAIGELSGGQLQRALLARAMVSDPGILILDEPNTFIDKKFEMQLNDFLKIISENTAIIMVSHNTGTLLPLAKNLAYINKTLHYYENCNIPPEIDEL
jgi:zinc transport system ATP-binding protein